MEGKAYHFVNSAELQNQGQGRSSKAPTKMQMHFCTCTVKNLIFPKLKKLTKDTTDGWMDI